MPNQAQGAITGADCDAQPTNSMRFDCSVLLDAVESVRFGHRILGSGDPWNWSEWTPSGTVHVKTVYNFQPGVTYEVVVDASSSSSTTVVLTSGPNLPTGLSGLRLVTGGTDPTPRSRYILVDTGGCDDKRYLFIYDTWNGYIAWYQDITAETGGTDLSGYSLTPEGTILAIVDKREVYEWALDGSLLMYVDYPNCGAGTFDGPCPHHDVKRSTNGETFVVTARPEEESSLAGSIYFGDVCPVYGSRFIDDGVQRLVGGLVLDDDTLMQELAYDPTVSVGPLRSGGMLAGVPHHESGSAYEDCQDTYYDDEFGLDDPPGALPDPWIDWTHVNSVAAATMGQFNQLFLSVPHFDEIVRYAPDTDTVHWRLSGELGSGDFDIGLAPVVDGEDVYGLLPQVQFAFQHDITLSNGHLQFLDNRKDRLEGPTRVLRFDLEPPVPPARGTATIIGMWVFPNVSEFVSRTCPTQGSAQTVPGTSGGTVLALCNGRQELLELSDSSGAKPASADYTLGVDQVDACDGSPTEVEGGWYRGYPMLDLGEY